MKWISILLKISENIKINDNLYEYFNLNELDCNYNVCNSSKNKDSLKISEKECKSRVESKLIDEVQEKQSNQKNMENNCNSFLNDVCVDKGSDTKTIFKQSDLHKYGLLNELDQIQSIFPE